MNLGAEFLNKHGRCLFVWMLELNVNNLSPESTNPPLIN